MKFTIFGDELNYNDILQLDGAFSVCHINDNESPIFYKTDGKDTAKNSRKNSLSYQEKIEDVIGSIHSFNGTEKDFKMNDRITLWKMYWLEYIHAFRTLTDSLPKSVVTIYTGRQAIEIGFKYLLLKKTGRIIKEHDLKELSNSLYSEYNIKDHYMEDVNTFCRLFGEYIEGGNVEYFRFPEYKGNHYFSGNRLDIKWLSYNLTLILLKLIHFAGLDAE